MGRFFDGFLSFCSTGKFFAKRLHDVSLTIAAPQIPAKSARTATFGPQRVGVPLRRVTVVHGHKGRLAAHRQAHIARSQLGIERKIAASSAEVRLQIDFRGRRRITNAFHNMLSCFFCSNRKRTSCSRHAAECSKRKIRMHQMTKFEV